MSELVCCVPVLERCPVSLLELALESELLLWELPLSELLLWLPPLELALWREELPELLCEEPEVAWLPLCPPLWVLVAAWPRPLWEPSSAPPLAKAGKVKVASRNPAATSAENRRSGFIRKTPRARLDCRLDADSLGPTGSAPCMCIEQGSASVADRKSVAARARPCGSSLLARTTAPVVSCYSARSPGGQGGLENYLSSQLTSM